jgi:hypothetical protein
VRYARSVAYRPRDRLLPGTPDGRVSNGPDGRSLVLNREEAETWADRHAAAIAAHARHVPLLLDAIALHTTPERPAPLLHAWRKGESKPSPVALRAWLSAVWLALSPAADAASWVELPVGYLRPFSVRRPAVARVRSADDGSTFAVAVQAKGAARTSPPPQGFGRHFHTVLADLERRHLLERRAGAPRDTDSHGRDDADSSNRYRGRGPFRPLFDSSLPVVATDKQRFLWNRRWDLVCRIASDDTETPSAACNPDDDLFGTYFPDQHEFVSTYYPAALPEDDDPIDELWWPRPDYIDELGMSDAAVMRPWMNRRVVNLPSALFSTNWIASAGSELIALVVASFAGLTRATPATLPPYTQLARDLRVQPDTVREWFRRANARGVLDVHPGYGGKAVRIEVGPVLRRVVGSNGPH